jgi:hypothetical protein
MSDLFGGGQQPPQQPPFHPINIFGGPDAPKNSGDKGIADRALNQDLLRYFSYQFPVFPGMTKLRDSEITDAYKQLTGPLSSDFQNTFVRNASVTSQGVTGGGDPFSGMGMSEGSFSRGGQTASVARQTMAKQDYDRARFEGLLQANPVPQLGLSQNDLLSLSIYNTGAQNAWSMSNYANNIAGANAQFAANQNDYNTIGNLISGLGSIYGNYQLNNAGSGVPPYYGQGFYG